MKLAALTLASRRTLPLARVAAASFLEHNPGIAFLVFLVDGDEELPAVDGATVLGLRDLRLAEPDRFRFHYPEMEFLYALTPYAIERVLDRGFDGALFLKLGTRVLGNLAPMLERLARHSVLLTPQLLEPLAGADALAREIHVLRTGAFNAGCLAFAGGEESRRFLGWWQDKTFRKCVLDLDNGIHYEQRWLDFAPAFMPGYGVIRDRGLVRFGDHDFPAGDGTYAYDRYDNGEPIASSARRKFRRLGDGALRFGNPFETAPEGSYYRWLRTPEAEGRP